MMANTGARGNLERFDRGTLRVTFLGYPDGPPPKDRVPIDQIRRPLTEWLIASSSAFHSDNEIPLKGKLNPTAHMTDDGQWPTDSDLAKAFAVIVAGPMDAAEMPEEWNQRMRTRVKGALFHSRLLSVMSLIIFLDIYENHEHLQLYGVGYGHQIIAQALLGDFVEVEQNTKSAQDWKVGLQEIELDSGFKEMFSLPEEKRSLFCQFLNSDHVVLKEDAKLPENWTIFGKSGLRKVQGLWEDPRVLTF